MEGDAADVGVVGGEVEDDEVGSVAEAVDTEEADGVFGLLTDEAGEEEEEEEEGGGGVAGSSALRLSGAGGGVGGGEAETFWAGGGRTAEEGEDEERREEEEEAEAAGRDGGEEDGEEEEDETAVPVVAEGEAAGCTASLLCEVVGLALTLSFHCAMMALAVSRTAEAAESEGEVEGVRVSLFTSTPICVCASSCALITECTPCSSLRADSSAACS